MTYPQQRGASMHIGQHSRSSQGFNAMVEQFQEYNRHLRILIGHLHPSPSKMEFPLSKLDEQSSQLIGVEASSGQGPNVSHAIPVIHS